MNSVVCPQLLCGNFNLLERIMNNRIWAAIKSIFQINNTKSTDIETQRNIVSEYGLFIENHPIFIAEIRDTSELPYSKEVILSAINMAIIYEENEKIVEFMQIGAAMLAYFQDNIGQKPLSLFGDASIPELQTAVQSRDPILMEEIKNMILSNPYKDKYETYSKIVANEFNDIKKNMAASIVIRNAIKSAINASNLSNYRGQDRIENSD